MKASWFFVILLLIFVAIFSVQNAGPIPVRFLGWEVTMSAALVIQLAALLGGLVGLTAGFWSRRPAAQPALGDPPVDDRHPVPVTPPPPENKMP